MRKLLALIVVVAMSGGIGVRLRAEGASAEQAPSRAPIADAAQSKETATVRKLIKEGGDVNAAQGDGMTALHYAALNGDADLAQMLLYAGANVGAKTRLGGYTPLHLAAQVGNANVIAPLVAAGSQVSTLTAT